MAPSAASMKGFGITIIVVLVAILLEADEVTGQSGCTSVLITLAPCLNYVSGSASTPSTSCCSQLATVVQSQPRCLCMLLNGGASSLGVTLNETLALALPGACKVETPPVSRCNAAGDGPAMSPIASPAASPTAASPSGGSNAAESASTGQGSTNSINKYLHFFTAAITLFVAIPMGGLGGS